MTWWQRLRRELGRETQPVDTAVRLIILERGIRGGLLLVLGIALVTDSQQVLAWVREWVYQLDLNPGRGLVHRVLVAVLTPVGVLPERTITRLGLASIAFAALELTEAIGLGRRLRWAEYLTALAGSLGIPFEIREVLHRQTPLRIAFLVINVAIVVYLIWKKRLFVGEGAGPGLTQAR